MTCNCLHPKIFVNPALPQLLATYRNYYFNGRWFAYSFDNSILFDRRFLRKFYKTKHSVNSDNIDNYFVVDDSGYKYPIYIQSKCGHCILCQYSSHNLYVSRLFAEAQLYKSRPWFVTLTYNDIHLPSSGVSVRDCQLFFKRLRINLSRKLNFNDKFRYFLCSEYGQDDKHTHRPHYHAIFFGLPSQNNSQVWQTREVVRKSWQNGFIKVRLINMVKPYEFFYTSKYLYKEQDVPDGMTKPFALSSRRHGGIGAAFFRKFRDDFFFDKPTSIHYVDRFSSKVREIPLFHYAMKYICPTFNESVPLSWRKNVHMFSSLFQAYQKYDDIRMLYGNFYDDLTSRLSPFMSLECPIRLTKRTNFSWAHYALNSLMLDIKDFLYKSDFLSFKTYEYARKDVYSRIASTVVSLSPQQLAHKAELLRIKLETKLLNKQLHYVD